MEDVKNNDLEEVKKELIELGKEEGEDVLKGAVEIAEKLIVKLLTGKSWAMYVLPLLPMVKSLLLEAIDKIDGKTDA